MIPYPKIDPAIFRIGGFEVRWYGLTYIVGFIAAFFIMKYLAIKKGVKLSGDDLWDYIFYLMLGVVIGGRLGYCLFYWPGGPGYFISHPLELFALWRGGMSFHGGLFGVLMAAIYCSYTKKIPFYDVADITAAAAPIGIGLGRLGNFINGELFGRPTDLPWSMVFPMGNIPERVINGVGKMGVELLKIGRHPSQLYESFLEGFILFAILFIINIKVAKRGIAFWSFLFFYGLFRFLVEFTREPDPHLGLITGPFTMGQLLSIPLILIGGGMLIKLMMTKAPVKAEKANKGPGKKGKKS